MNSYSVVVIAQNEESNIAFCLRPVLRFSDDVWVVDSFSTDGTVEIGRTLGARVVQHEFEGWAEQRNYALDRLPLKYDYVLFLDADEQIDERFDSQLTAAIASGRYAAFNLKTSNYFLGRHIKFAQDISWITKVVRRGAGRWHSEGAREYCVVNGPVGEVPATIRHEDRKGIFFWVIKQIRNAEREARLLSGQSAQLDLRQFSSGQTLERPQRVWLRRVYNTLPPVVRPFLVFIYRYFFRLGFLDGIPGLIYCLLHGFWYNLIIDARLLEMPLGHECYLPVYGGEKANRPGAGPCEGGLN